MSDDREKVEPTPERLMKEKMRRTDAGAYMIEYRCVMDLMFEEQWIDHSQQWALERYDLMRYIATRHLGSRITQFAERIAHEVGVDPEEVPTLRDGFRYVEARLNKREKNIIEYAIADILVRDDREMLYTAARQLAGHVYHTSKKLNGLIEDFHRQRKDLIEAAGAVSDVIEFGTSVS